jgi:hypothetical protein
MYLPAEGTEVQGKRQLLDSEVEKYRPQHSGIDSLRLLVLPGDFGC